ncbi:hypothetical protein FJZ31_23955 [Candidatus Poribacteria bacterium]|nr:hypothetical protein [Candidatus Poribacteria bacterium]
MDGRGPWIVDCRLLIGDWEVFSIDNHQSSIINPRSACVHTVGGIYIWLVEIEAIAIPTSSGRLFSKQFKVGD